MKIPDYLTQKFLFKKSLADSKLMHRFWVEEKESDPAYSDQILWLLPEGFAADNQIIEKFDSFFSAYIEMEQIRNIPLYRYGIRQGGCFAYHKRFNGKSLTEFWNTAGDPAQKKIKSIDVIKEICMGRNRSPRSPQGTLIFRAGLNFDLL